MRPRHIPLPRLLKYSGCFCASVAINRWSTANLITVSEELSGGRKFIRAHIKTEWSWFSWSLVLVVALASIFAAVTLAPKEPFAWFLVSSVALVALIIEDRRWQPVWALNSALEAAAKELDLERFETKGASASGDATSTKQPALEPPTAS